MYIFAALLTSGLSTVPNVDSDPVQDDLSKLEPLLDVAKEFVKTQPDAVKLAWNETLRFLMNIYGELATFATTFSELTGGHWGGTLIALSSLCLGLVIASWTGRLSGSIFWRTLGLLNQQRFPSRQITPGRVYLFLQGWALGILTAMLYIAFKGTWVGFGPLTMEALAFLGKLLFYVLLGEELWWLCFERRKVKAAEL